MSDPSEFHDRMFDYELTEDQKRLRDYFVEEYLKDYDAFYAATRCGFLASFAVEWSKRLLQESYVQRRIAEVSLELSEEEKKRRFAAHVENMRKLSYTGPESSRVSAGKLYGELMGWHKDNTPDTAAQNLVEAFKDIAKRVPV